MIEVYRKAMIGQYEAALFTLKDTTDICPDEMWNAPVSDNAFCECVFHALFFGGLYLGPNVEALRQQAFHLEHPEIFRDYEEMEDRKPELLYDRQMIETYFAFVHAKMLEVMAAETEASLAEPVGFPWLDIARTEMHPYNIRHLHHHAAQLSLKLRLETDLNPKWVKSGQSNKS